MPLVVLSKKIMEQLLSDERRKLEKYENVHRMIGDKMIKAQSEYTQYVRKTNDSTSLKARKLADKGFKYEYMAIKAKNELEGYQKLLKKKYTN
jgi:hypothetical protein